MRAGVRLLVALAGLAAPPLEVSGDPLQYPFRVANVCPFECCQFGTWTAHQTIFVFARERDTGSPAFSIARNESFTAVRGAYWTLAPVIVRPRAPLELRVESGLRLVAPDRAELRETGSTSEERVAVAAGADVEVLAYLGEGDAVGIAAGKPVGVSGISPPYSREGAAPDFVVVPPAGATQWWIEVRYGNRRGWFERGKYDIDGSDRCE